jgi:sulfoxide reductase heme-binding subunit YedZ
VTPNTRRTGSRRGRLQAGVATLGLLPFAVLLIRAAGDGLGANPIEAVTHVTGEWGLRLLLASLAVTPARRILGWSWAAPLRRTLGLLAFFYICLHLLTYVVLDHFFDWELLVEDVLERRYVTMGFLGFCCLLPLALTSTRRAMKRLGRSWVRLHRLAYVAGVAGVVHYVWLVKADLAPPLAHAAVLALLFGARLWPRAPRRRDEPTQAQSRRDPGDRDAGRRGQEDRREDSSAPC